MNRLALVLAVLAVVLSAPARAQDFELSSNIDSDCFDPTRCSGLEFTVARSGPAPEGVCTGLGADYEELHFAGWLWDVRDQTLFDADSDCVADAWMPPPHDPGSAQACLRASSIQVYAEGRMGLCLLPDRFTVDFFVVDLAAITVADIERFPGTATLRRVGPEHWAPLSVGATPYDIRLGGTGPGGFPATGIASLEVTYDPRARVFGSALTIFITEDTP